LPKLMTLAGYGLKSSLAFLMVLNMGAIIGAIGAAGSPTAPTFARSCSPTS
jgi:hypothetical protein